MANIGILGAGTWGMALARMIFRTGHATTVWSALPQEVDELSTTRKHRNLPGMVIPDGIVFTKNMEEAIRNKDVVLFAVPSVFVRSTAEKAAPYLEENAVVVDVAKGLEAGTLLTMTGGDCLRGPEAPAARGPVRSHPCGGGGSGPAHLHRGGQRG